MQVVITMAGLGSRFKKAGYACPKYQIKAFDKTLFEWSMESLKGYYDENNAYFFIVRKEDAARDFIEDACEKCGIRKDKVTVIEIDYLTDGQATTALLANRYWDANDCLMIYNIDTYVESFEMKAEDIEGDGFIPCFKADGDHWSFVELGDDGNATQVREKVRISDNCTLGAYYFRSCKLYEQIYNEYYTQGRALDANERYVAPLYNYMIQNGMKVRISLVDASKVHVLGTPEELRDFIAQGENGQVPNGEA